MEEKRANLLLVIPVTLIALFFIYLLVNPTQITGMGIATFKENISNPRNIAIIAVIVGGIIVAYVFTRMKKKKSKLQTPQELNLKTTESGKKLSKDEITKIFSEENLPEIKKPEIKPKPKEKPKKKFKPQKKLTHLDELITLLATMFNQKIPKHQILKKLTKQGWSPQQIEKAVEELNIRTLKQYISTAQKRGFSKKQIVYALNVKGWSKEHIKKALINLK